MSDEKLPAKSNTADVQAFLDKLARTQTVKTSGGKGRLIFALDATASREPTWDRACQLQGEMFQETAALGGLEVQLVYYRGFGEFQATAWLSDPAALQARMAGVSCLGGKTQIGKLLRHALAETKLLHINAVVFVGDCMEEDVDRLCHEAGELALLGVPMFVFHEGADPAAERAFRQFAQLTGDPPTSIERYYRENGHDLLFMGTSHHSRIFEMVLGSTTEFVMRSVNGPFFLER